MILFLFLFFFRWGGAIEYSCCPNWQILREEEAESYSMWQPQISEA